MFKKSINKINLLNIAWIGQGDFGDEVMAFVLRRFLKKVMNIDKITYYQYGNFPNFRGENDLKISSLYSFDAHRWQRRILDKFYLKRFNSLIIGGGSILHSSGSILWKYNILEKIKKINNDRGLCACVGVSLPEFKTTEEKDILATLLKRVDVFITRDNLSAEVAKKICDRGNIYSSIDLSLLLSEFDLYNKCLNNDENMREDDLVGIMFTRNKATEKLFQQRRHMDKYLSIINKITSQNKRIVLFALYVGDAYADIELNQLLRNKAKHPEKITIHSYDGDIFRTIREMNRCSFIISRRLHGIIFAYMMGIPFLSLDYDSKNYNFCETIGYPLEMSVDFNSLEEMDVVFEKIDTLFKRRGLLLDSCYALEDATNKVKENLNILKEKIN